MARGISGVIKVAMSILVLLLAAAAATIGGAVGGEIQLDWMFPAEESASSVCEGTIGECMPEEEEMVDSETSRRMLAWRGRYISYGALRRNFIPCSRRGQSYYFCRPGRAVNPYRRGCSHITRCRS